MEIDITKKSEELKAYVSQFETTMFLGDISSLMQFIRFDNPINSLNGLTSPQRQLLYLAGLNITSEVKNREELKAQYSNEDFEHMKSILIDIENGYNQFFFPKPDDVIDENWEKKRTIAMPTFLSYFNQGLLNFEEQTIERITEYFTPFNNEIQKHFGLEVLDFIEIYNFIDGIPNNFLKDNINPKEGQQTWEEFCKEMQQKGLMPWEWQEHLPEHFTNLFNWMYDKGRMFRFSKQAIADRFGKEKADSFLNVFTCERKKDDFLYYTEVNPIHNKPIFKISEDEYQAVDMHQTIQAVYNTLVNFCVSQKKIDEKFYAVRGKKLEEKIERVFQRFFKNKSFVHKSFYTQDKHEQDLLFIYEGLALIVEAKASKRDEPRRDPDKAYPLILSNFEETIQKGYDQTYRVKSKFIDNEVLNIYSDQELKNHVIDIRTKNYPKIFSIVVTLERFGQIQSDLDSLLEIYEDDNFPWSVCIDDLESFLLVLEKLGRKKNDFIKFLDMREQLHGRLITSDELEVCGAFLSNKITREQLKDENITFALTPDLTEIFDVIYRKEGLGFDNEKNIELKKSGKCLPIGGY
ncbi:hypothetical protein M2451_003072 [Dysgonomonas sp. PFB1-18]|uniref:hypothetical protein n=1 Tax=unclassified Dysgonomonas TaxID=2630389 RepID=UPI002474FDB2|nr:MULTISPECIES: hypothetical protein [unclassified Dysgonomonas]MDH6310180.1 hypothetical protein [Dysgonomonas sp. PF1-14]MDH6340154.1 hypothetical protein [Dysgonomonas sp. PF1-16]MDH6381737.1 hypothetical protein [Dysgonomonas sp. PFB1-18]MDH6399096.1 hypothetical protein [Dysgonomonas sp. PF1-23]